MNEKSALIGVIEGRCPQCRQEHLFMTGPYTLKFLEMHKTCGSCDLQYEREPGFFFGAMFISYAFSVGIVLVTGALVFFIGSDPSTSTYIIWVIAVSLFLYPINFRYSRILFLHLFAGMKYDRDKVK